MTYLPTTQWPAGRPREYRTSLWAYLALVVLIGLRLASGQTGLLAYMGLGVYALFGRGYAIRALALSFLFTMINPGIAPETGGAAVGRYIVLLGAAASAFLHGTILTGDRRIHTFTMFTMLLGLLIVGHSIFFSQVVDVSILKAISWMLAITTLISCWTGMSPSEREETERQLFWGLVLLMLLSLPLLVLPVGYLRNGSGFQGLLNQPQAFGPVMGLLGAWTATRMLADRKPGWPAVGLTGASIALVLMSGARTAGLAMVGAIALSIMLVPWLSGQPVRRLFPGLGSARIWFVVFAVLIAGIVMAPMLAETVNRFILKSGSGSSLLESYEQSRGGLIDRMLANIAERPLTGIGFGIGSNYTQMVIERDPLLGLPSSVPVEKGVTPIAVVEELGFPLAMVVFWWLLVLIRRCAHGGLVPFTICTTVLLLNFGEATFFSPGGLGMLWLIMLTWAYSHGKARARYG